MSASEYASRAQRGRTLTDDIPINIDDYDDDDLNRPRNNSKSGRRTTVRQKPRRIATKAAKFLGLSQDRAPLSTSNSSLNSTGSRRKVSKKNSIFSLASSNSFAQSVRSNSSSPSLMNEMIKRKKSLRSKSSRSTLADMHEITARKMGYVMPGDDDDLEFSAQKPPTETSGGSGVHFALRSNHSRTRSSVSRSTADEEMESALTKLLLLSNRDAIQAKWQMCQCCCLIPATWKRNKRRSSMRREEEVSQVRTKRIAQKSFESSSSSSPYHVGSWKKNTSSMPKPSSLPETPMWIPKESFGAMFNFQCNFVRGVRARSARIYAISFSYLHHENLTCITHLFCYTRTPNTSTLKYITKI